MKARNRKPMPVGTRFGRLVVQAELPTVRGRSRSRCICDCGKTVDVNNYALRSGNTMSCGCLQKQRTSCANKTHGKSGTKLYRCYLSMISRCYRNTDAAFVNYGGRGITVCDEWRGSFSSFAEWAESSGYVDGLTIERIDVDKGYSPSNCTWLPKAAQSKNRRSTHMVEIDGRQMCLSDAARHFGVVSPRVAQGRVRCLKWDLMSAVTKPSRSSRKEGT